ncbi:helix-turn-helix transcriptional regulator [Planomonospora venezuelensis]|uniref:Transcriptional regulator with XRE-family HTH domain n=1 Tax=Planomonospora venezuelensis TaxID=1999 RepID=A0A841CX14_PLAVE|nr:helix-turn-helix transcriptional regulator [Planomonospora venezuelensis]MBB5960854.1 transcriptional regulator with XRE-family HTH domain [Planomonospora venezuelensis]GIN01087.1 hypothetical protein Pve01_27450 [Planomonospora venezuelensis]
MKNIKVSPERFKQIRVEKGVSAYALARMIGSSSAQMWRIDSGRFTTSTLFLQRLVPVFGEEAVASLLVDDDQREHFLNACARLRGIQQV